MKKFCERGKPCRCAFHTHKQHLFYEFVNLSYLQRWSIAVDLGFCDGDPFKEPGLLLGEVMLHAQNAGLLAWFWGAVKREGGDLRGACPLF